jgi:hypothetical protein
MAAMSCKRIVVGGLLGGLAWNILSTLLNVVFLGKFYMYEQKGGGLLKDPRYAMFPFVWMGILFVLGIVLAWLYAASRSTLGPGPASALKVGLAVGIIAGVPLNFAQACWAPITQWLPLGWMLDMLVGSVLATLVAGWYYRES